MVTSDYYHA